VSDTSSATGPKTGNEFDSGPVVITWTIQGDHNEQVQVDVTLNGKPVASNLLGPNDTNWDTGKHKGSDAWVDASFRFQVPTPGQEGQLELITLVWEQGSGGEQTTADQLLAIWQYKR
jgi:hypothetical protein